MTLTTEADLPQASFALATALHEAALELPPNHLEDMSRLMKVLVQIHGFRLYFAEIDAISYRDQLIAKLNGVLPAVGKVAVSIDLSSYAQAVSFADFEAALLACAPDTIVHLLNSEVWLAQHAAELNIRRNAIASHAHCACVWWLPRSAIARMATEAPDVWSWRHGIFGFAVGQKQGTDEQVDTLQLKSYERQSELLRSGSFMQKSKRFAHLRQLLEQNMSDDIRFGLVIEMADLLYATGDLTQALALLQTQALPLAATVFLEQPAVHAGTMGQIANILTLRGEFDEALRIYREEVLPVYDKLGDLRNLAFTQGNIANILASRGELDEALHIYREEELPVYEKLGDLRNLTLTQGKIAAILTGRGEFDAALRILREEAMPVYEKLGDLRHQALTQGNIANVLVSRGEFDEALFIRRKIEMPVYEKLGDMYSLLICKVNLALNLAARGQANDAAEIETLLREAHQIAQKMGLSEQKRIEEIYLKLFNKPP